MAEVKNEKKGFTISIILLIIVALVAIVIFGLMIGRSSGVDGNKTQTPGAATVNLRLLIG